MTTKTTLPMTPEIRFWQVRHTVLSNALPTVMAPTWWWRNGISMAERVTFLRELADARSSLFSYCERTYPELKGKPYSISDTSIEFETVEEPEGGLRGDPVAQTGQEVGPRDPASSSSENSSRVSPPEAPQ